jgi:AcrR family transcriptional regulator
MGTLNVRNKEDKRLVEPDRRDRSTQADRSARTRSALLESAARGLSRYGYGNLVLEQVASDAGYTRGALYHQFKDKQELTLAAFEWVLETWEQEVGRLVEKESDPVAALLTLARGHAVFCRRDIARVAIALRVEFSGQDHPVGREVEKAYELLLKDCVRLIEAGREAGSIPPGLPARVLALAFVGALEGVVIALAGQAPHDELLAARAAAGVLGLDSHPADAPKRIEVNT